MTEEKVLKKGLIFNLERNRSEIGVASFMDTNTEKKVSETYAVKNVGKKAMNFENKKRGRPVVRKTSKLDYQLSDAPNKKPE